ncbi:MAG: hypothetical protein AAFX46_08780, partial [Cyanobacteria bacterium J06636_27]
KITAAGLSRYTASHPNPLQKFVIQECFSVEILISFGYFLTQKNHVIFDGEQRDFVKTNAIAKPTLRTDKLKTTLDIV